MGFTSKTGYFGEKRCETVDDKMNFLSSLLTEEKFSAILKLREGKTKVWSPETRERGDSDAERRNPAILRGSAGKGLTH